MADTQTASSTATKGAVTEYAAVKQNLQSEAMKAEFKMALPPQMPPDRFIRVAITAINQNEDLLRCDRQSLYRSLMKSAQDGLLPDGQEAAIVPFGNQAQYMPMVKGLLKKIRNSGELGSITAEIVYKNDDFRYWIDEDGVHLKHEPLLDEDRGEIRGVYALAKTKDGAVYFEFMTTVEVEKVRQSSRAKNATPWTQWWDQMAKKTAIRRLSKRLPMSTDLDDLIRRDDELHDIESTVTDGKPKGDPSKPGRLSKLLEGAATERQDELLITIDEDPAAAAGERERVAARQKELEAQKEKLKAGGAPSAEEQKAIAHKEAFEAKEFKCTKCPPFTFSTDSEEEMEVHGQKEHPQPPGQQKKQNGGGKPASDGDMFGQRK